MFKILILVGGIFMLYRWWSQPSLGPPSDEDSEDFADYEEVD